MATRLAPLRPVTALCDHCGKITDVDFKQKNHPNNIQETYFKCEYCFYHYTAFVTDAKVRKMQLDIQSLQGIGLMPERRKLQTKVNTRMKELKHNLINFGRADL